MIDVHSHIIPGIDDGARTMDMALAMARQTVDAGVTHLVCTPHIHWGHYDNTIDTIKAGFLGLREEIIKNGIELNISFAGEVRVSELIPGWMAEKQLPFLGQHNGKSVLLLEMPHSHIPAGFDNLLRWLQASKVQPLIPHPERNRDILKRPEKIQWLRNQGCLLQVTAGALTGRFGEQVRDVSLEMLANRQIDLVASDTHDTERRPNDMGQAYVLVSEQVDQEYADKLFKLTPGKIVGVYTA
ncbi:histidinol-phosphatase [Alteromonas pelagimontana]|uniref:protein-tyrosine-phosphatase n=1 Tax=Alteromonas pelagimontana TaxID=1858656 RepID=A0A6M4MAZ5_9ALTE|nr:CpsB/CapC family capsule biosynthesis tyrosine phosphatase [Alteromonas pelagimontana]QJR80197.1 histidinol-phosphatase [Alteromonas pelagimontana]